MSTNAYCGTNLAVRVIPCLDVDGGRVVKGVNFENLRDAGDPVRQRAAAGEGLNAPTAGAGRSSRCFVGAPRKART